MKSDRGRENARLDAPEEAARPMWYVGSTRSRHEKEVEYQLQQRSVECFLPIYEEVHRWKNGRHRVQLPLFPGYVFVRIALRDKLRVLQVPGLVRLVGFQGGPVALPEGEVEAMRTALGAGLNAAPHPYLSVGDRVEVCRGPLQGMKGILLRQPGKCRVVISVELIMRAMVVELDAEDVIPLQGPWPGAASGWAESVASGR